MLFMELYLKMLHVDRPRNGLSEGGRLGVGMVKPSKEEPMAQLSYSSVDFFVRWQASGKPTCNDETKTNRDGCDAVGMADASLIGC